MQARSICTCVRLQGNAQLGKIFNKVLNSDRTKKSRYKEAPNTPAIAAVPSFRQDTKKPTHKNRRVTVLNKVFMKYITDLMATGEVAAKLVGKGIEVSHVNVSPDFKLVNVYWFAQNECESNEATENILKKAAGHLQHELTQLRVIGKVPPINFVKNKRYYAEREIESRLSTVDFGENFVPQAYLKNYVQTPVIQMSLSPDIKAKISQLSNTNDKEIEEDSYELRIPEMQQDVLGFDHATIMKRVKSSLNLSTLAQQKRILGVNDEPQGNLPLSDDVTTFLSSKEEQTLFKDFLKRRLVEEKRRSRAISLLEAKLKDEEERLENKYDVEYDMDEINIDEDIYTDHKNSELD